MSEQTHHQCVCGATVRVSELTVHEPTRRELPTDLEISHEFRIVHRFAHLGSGMTDRCYKHVVALREQVALADLQALREIDEQWQAAHAAVPPSSGQRARSASDTMIPSGPRT